MRKQHLSFSSACEYTKPAEISASRSDFFHGRTNILLVTERFHFFRRFKLRGIKHVIFYSPPLNSQFYSEFLNSIEGASPDCMCVMLYCKYDALALERIVGTDRLAAMLEARTSTHLFC